MGTLIAHAADAPHAHGVLGLIALLALSLLAVALATALLVVNRRRAAHDGDLEAAPAVAPSSSAG